MNGQPLLGEQVQVTVSSIQDGASTVFVACANGAALGMARVTCTDAQILGVLARAIAYEASAASRKLVAAPGALADGFRVS